MTGADASPPVDTDAGADTPFMVSPGLHRHDRTGVDCAACLVIDEANRALAIARHPSRSTASPSDGSPS